jgi:hypothetical protein
MTADAMPDARSCTEHYYGAGTLISDIDGDGNQDLISTSTSMFGRADGSFRRAPAFDGDPNEQYVAADMNADGKVDLVSGAYSTMLRVRIGNGDGTFEPPLITQGPVAIVQDSVGDLNVDGKLDVGGRCRHRHERGRQVGRHWHDVFRKHGIGLARQR